MGSTFAACQYLPKAPVAPDWALIIQVFTGQVWEAWGSCERTKCGAVHLPRASKCRQSRRRWATHRSSRCEQVWEGRDVGPV